MRTRDSKGQVFYTRYEEQGKKTEKTNMEVVLPATDPHDDVDEEQRCPNVENFTK